MQLCYSVLIMAVADGAASRLWANQWEALRGGEHSRDRSTSRRLPLHACLHWLTGWGLFYILDVLTIKVA